MMLFIVIAMTFVLTTYIEAAMALASYDKLEDGSFAGEIKKLPGVIAFARTLKQCEAELRSTLEDWILVGLRLGHELPRLARVYFPLFPAL
jgi:predicted RNase H-like HicB family nuclease